jgi:sarcosine oxidase subunit beta
MVAEQQTLGLNLAFLPDNAAVRDVAPALAETVLAASYCPTDGHANPVAAVQAFAAAAQRHGADIRTESAVTAIDTAGGRVHGVRTDEGRIAADAVVVAAGVHAPRLCAPLGIDLPIHIGHVSVVQTVPLPSLIAQVLGVASADLALRQEAGGRVRFTGGGSPWPHDLDALAHGNDLIMPPAGHVATTLARAVEVLPVLANAPLARVWGGLLDMTPDALPVIERSPLVDGLIIAAGFSGHGFCLGPVTGEIVRDLVQTGSTSYPIAPFRGDRFGQTAARVAATLHG